MRLTLINGIKEVCRPLIKTKEQRLEKYLKIDKNLDKDALCLLYPNRERLAKHAKSKGVEIRIYDAQKDHYNNMAMESRAEFDTYQNKIGITVYPLKPKKEKNGWSRTGQFSLIPKDVKQIDVRVETKPLVFEIPSDGLQYVRIAKSEYDENFLRKVYRIISELSNKVSPKSNK